MDSSEEIAAGFAERLAEICSDKGLPERGRQSELARMLGLTQPSVGKWLHGIGLPRHSIAIKLAEWGGVNVQWLLQGKGPKHGSTIDTKSLVLADALQSLPTEERREVFAYIEYKLNSAKPLFTKEQTARYKVMINAFRKDIDKPN